MIQKIPLQCVEAAYLTFLELERISFLTVYPNRVMGLWVLEHIQHTETPWQGHHIHSSNGNVVEGTRTYSVKPEKGTSKSALRLTNVQSM